MKSLQQLFIGFLVIFVSCSSMQKKHATDKIKFFITGTYVRAFEGEYSIGNDTLIIIQPGLSDNYYIVQHKMSYQQIKDKQPLPVEYKTENWTTIFNGQTNVLEEQKKGKRLSFLPDENALLLGNSKFKKIK